MREQLALLPEYLGAHLRLTLLALAAGLALSVPLGVWIARRGRGGGAVLGCVSVLQTVPGLALLAVMVPLLAWLGGWTRKLAGWAPPAIGAVPALAALTVYSLLPILRNTVTGLRGVPAELVDAARALGMTPRQRLFKVELPLALPVIAAGLRTAAVWVVGTATLSTPVGAPSLGNYIFGGLQTRNFAAVLTGCLAAAALALGLDQVIRQLERALAGRRIVRLAAVGALLLALAVWSLAGLVPSRAAGRELTVGAKTFTEQYILAELLAAALRGAAAGPVRVAPSLGSTVALDALAAGEIDAYVDYSGTIWTTLLGGGGAADRETVLEEVRRGLAARLGVAVVARLGFENAYALAMRRADARRLGVDTVSDLAGVASALELGTDYEFLGRPEWRRLEELYGLDFAAERVMDPSLMYQALAAGAVDVASVYSTDGRIAALDLAVLEDDRGAIPPYDAIVLSRLELLEERPAVAEALAALEGGVDADEMRRMNLEVDRDKRLPAAVAAEFLARRRRESPRPRRP